MWEVNKSLLFRTTTVTLRYEEGSSPPQVAFRSGGKPIAVNSNEMDAIKNNKNQRIFFLTIRPPGMEYFQCDKELSLNQFQTRIDQTRAVLIRLQFYYLTFDHLY